MRNEHEPPPAETYSEDGYDLSVMEHLYPRYVEAFRRYVLASGEGALTGPWMQVWFRNCLVSR